MALARRLVFDHGSRLMQLYMQLRLLQEKLNSGKQIDLEELKKIVNTMLTVLMEHHLRD